MVKGGNLADIIAEIGKGLEAYDSSDSSTKIASEAAASDNNMINPITNDPIKFASLLREEAKIAECASANTDKLAAEKAEADKLAAEKAEADKLAAEKAEADKVAAENMQAIIPHAPENESPLNNTATGKDPVTESKPMFSPEAVQMIIGAVEKVASISPVLAAIGGMGMGSGLGYLGGRVIDNKQDKDNYGKYYQAGIQDMARALAEQMQTQQGGK